MIPYLGVGVGPEFDISVAELWYADGKTERKLLRKTTCTKIQHDGITEAMDKAGFFAKVNLPHPASITGYKRSNPESCNTPNNDLCPQLLRILSGPGMSDKQ